MIKQQALGADDVGYLVVDLQDGRVIDGRNADRAFVPGSVIKLATSLVAWRNLGAGFHFTTRLWQQGDDLYLQGGGDPVLTAADLQALAQQVRRLKPTAIWRHFYIDATAVAASPLISDRQPLAADYNPGFGALNVDFNRLALDWTAAPTGKPLFRISSLADELTVAADWLQLTPATDVLPAGAPFILASPGSAIMPEAWQYDPDLAHAGLPPNGRMFLPVKQADLMTALIFRAVAGQAGLALPPPQAALVPPTATLLVTHDSPALPDLLRGLLRYSNNLSAELIGLANATRLTGRVTSLAEAARQHVLWLAAYLTGTDWRSFRMINHSGLDGDNRATPRQMIRLLQEIATDPLLAATLPVLRPTVDADLQQVGEVAQPPAGVAKGYVLSGKSGTMTYAAGLAGLVSAPDGQRFAYVIFMVDAKRRAALEAAFDPRILKPDEATRQWTRQARSLEAALLLHWFPDMR